MSNQSLYAVILAGGSGTRFWPKSRQSYPKQFLNIYGDLSLLQATVKRILPLIPAKNVLIVTSNNHKAEVKRQLSKYKIPSNNILLEPSGKNTAPAICWASLVVHARNPRATIAVLPSDHLILNESKFLILLKQATALAQNDFLVTLGITPTRPETGYGYLKTKYVDFAGKRVCSVEQFLEKPNLKKAQKFFKNPNYFWNSGMFIWRTKTILTAFAQKLPNVYEPLKDKLKQFKSVWGKLPSISVDYGILEKANNVVTIPAKDIGWSDLGSWESLFEHMPKDHQNNAYRGDVISLNCEGSLFWGHKRLIAAIGLKDFMVIDTPDALLIGPKNRSQEVKDIVSHLKKKNRKEL